MAHTPAPLTNNFGTDGAFQAVMMALVPAARDAFHSFLVDHSEVQAAAAQLRPDVFQVFLDNNASRFVRQFELATR